MPSHRMIRWLGHGMVLLGLLVTAALLMLARDVPVMTESLGIVLRGQYFGAAATTLAGIWFQRCVLASPPAGFPVD